MAQDIVSGLFGLSPYEAQMQQQQMLDKQAMQFSAMDPLQIPAYLAGRAGQAFGGMLAESQGMVNPVVAQSQERQQALAGLDPSSSQSLLAKAQQVSDPKIKIGLIQLADQAREREMKMADYQAKTEETKRKTAAAAQKEAFVKQILANPEVSEDVKNYIRMGGDISKFIDPQTIAPGAVFGMPNFKGGFTELAKGAPKEDTKPQSVKEFEYERDNFGYKGTFKDWLKAKKEAQTVVKVEGTSNEIDEPTIDYMARQALTGDKSVLIGLARTKGALAKVRSRMAKVAAEEGITPAQLAVLNAEYFGQTAGQRVVGTRTAAIEIAASEANKMADITLDLFGKVNPSQFPSLNALENAVEKQLGGPEIVALKTSINSFVNAYARAINPTGMSTVSDKQHARELIDAAMGRQQLPAAIATMKREMEAALAAPAAVKQAMRDRALGGSVAPKQSTVSGGAASAIPTETPVVTSKYNPVTGKIERIQ